jgi:hypothetical protein
MAIPATPTNFYATQGNGQVYLQWQIVTGATSYNVQRSTDGVTFTTIATPTLTQYLDTSVTIGTVYYYQVAAVSGVDVSTYTTSQAIIPTMGGEMSLAELEVQCRNRADRLNSNFVTTPELHSYINQSQYELYDILIDAYEDYYKAPSAIFFSVGGNQQIYPMPNGILTFKNSQYQDFVPPPIYKLLGIDMGLNTSNNGWVTVDKYNFIDRNRFFYPNTASTIYGVFNVQYRWMGDKLELIPVPSAGQPFRIQYIPRLPVLLQPNDLTSTSISGWLEYVITDVAIKILQKEESDVSVLMAQKLALKQRIEQSASNRDAGRPDSISDVRGNGWWNRNLNFNGPSGGW